MKADGMDDALFLAATQADLTVLVSRAGVVPAGYRGEVAAALAGLQAHARRVRSALPAKPSTEVLPAHS